MSATPALCVVMPVYNGRSLLESSLPPLLEAREREGVEVIVVDDGSTDGSAEFAAGLGARVEKSGGCKLGPAAARNVGSALTEAGILLFVDADVVVHPDAFDQVRAAFQDQAVSAVFGAYDENPPHRGFASQYMNLRHHFVHQDPTDDAQTFWSGLGAVRRSAFEGVGGFDPERFPRPSIEDIELGLRLREAGGRIRRIPTLRGTHLKEWSLAEVLRTDVVLRALPWARLMHEHPGAFSDLNVGVTERLKSVLAGVFALTLLVALAGLAPLWLPLAILGVAGLANRPLFTLFQRRNGWWFALRALLYHQIYYLYSGAVFVLAGAQMKLGERA